MTLDNDWSNYRRRTPESTQPEKDEAQSKRTGIAALLGRFELFQAFPDAVLNRFFRNAIFLIISTMVLVACFPFVLASLLGPTSTSADASGGRSPQQAG